MTLTMPDLDTVILEELDDALVCDVLVLPRDEKCPNEAHWYLRCPACLKILFYCNGHADHFRGLPKVKCQKCEHPYDLPLAVLPL